ncbi:hypothetical protein [Cypionkella sp.]|uniref:hypothetical protein n=1 Tax=Cypionkella sp. TaxID=2811411 RepID=UPI002630D1F0|nr:hypothetical protein [Cypionkella sp.]MDB5663870.1 hypothetical protein [Cypionkella sp.]
MPRNINDTELGLLRAASDNTGYTLMIAAGLDTAHQRIASADTYIDAQSPFDRHARIGIPQGAATVDQTLFLAYLGTQILPWSDDETQKLTKITANLRLIFDSMSLHLPERIYLVKSTGREEAAAAYTRHLDTIVLPANMVASLYATPPGGDPLHPGQSTEYLAGVVTHELFHLLSKNNPAWRAQLYGCVGYRVLENSVALPDTKGPNGFSLCDLKITNPDAPLLNVAVDLIPPGETDPCPMVPVLASSQPYATGEFFDTLNWFFLAVEREAGQWKARRHDAMPAFNPSDPTDPMLMQYLAKVGRNFTGELFHPDEVLAQNFVIAAAEPSLDLLKQIRLAIWPYT